MPNEHEIRAAYDCDTITIYQAYPPAIADAALVAGRFVAPKKWRKTHSTSCRSSSRTPLIQKSIFAQPVRRFGKTFKVKLTF